MTTQSYKVHMHTENHHFAGDDSTILRVTVERRYGNPTRFEAAKKAVAWAKDQGVSDAMIYSIEEC